MLRTRRFVEHLLRAVLFAARLVLVAAAVTSCGDDDPAAETPTADAPCCNAGTQICADNESVDVVMTRETRTGCEGTIGGAPVTIECSGADAFELCYSGGPCASGTITGSRAVIGTLTCEQWPR